VLFGGRPKFSRGVSTCILLVPDRTTNNGVAQRKGGWLLSWGPVFEPLSILFFFHLIHEAPSTAPRTWVTTGGPAHKWCKQCGPPRCSNLVQRSSKTFASLRELEVQFRHLIFLYNNILMQKFYCDLSKILNSWRFLLSFCDVFRCLPQKLGPN